MENINCPNCSGMLEALETIALNLTSLISAYPDKYPRHAFQGTLDIARTAIADYFLRQVK